MSEELQKLLPYSVKIEADQKCLKISTHVYCDDGVQAVDNAVHMWLDAAKRLKQEGFTVAPLDVKER